MECAGICAFRSSQPIVCPGDQSEPLTAEKVSTIEMVRSIDSDNLVYEAIAGNVRLLVLLHHGFTNDELCQLTRKGVAMYGQYTCIHDQKVLLVSLESEVALMRELANRLATFATFDELVNSVGCPIPHTLNKAICDTKSGAGVAPRYHKYGNTKPTLVMSNGQVRIYRLMGESLPTKTAKFARIRDVQQNTIAYFRKQFAERQGVKGTVEEWVEGMSKLVRKERFDREICALDASSKQKIAPMIVEFWQCDPHSMVITDVVYGTAYGQYLETATHDTDIARVFLRVIRNITNLAWTLRYCHCNLLGDTNATGNIIVNENGDVSFVNFDYVEKGPTDKGISMWITNQHPVPSGPHGDYYGDGDLDSPDRVRFLIDDMVDVCLLTYSIGTKRIREGKLPGNGHTFSVCKTIETMHFHTSKGWADFYAEYIRSIKSIPNAHIMFERIALTFRSADPYLPMLSPFEGTKP